jgi:HEAT repeat protein
MMTKRRLLWLLTGLFLLAVLALLVPGSPVYAPRLFMRYARFYDGHSSGYWMDALNSPDAKLRKRAIYSLGTIGSKVPEAVPAIARIMLDDDDADLRREASLALLKMIPASGEAVPALAQALADEDPLVRMYAANTLFRLGGRSQPAIPALLNAIKHPRNQILLPRFSQTIQEMAILALGRAGVASQEVAAALMESLESAQTVQTRIATIRALGDVGTEARTAVPHLHKLLDDDNEDEDVRQVAKETLQKIDS